MSPPPFRHPLLLVVGLAGLLAGPGERAWAQPGATPKLATIRGSVIDRATNAPLAGASVLLTGAPTLAADEAGRFAHRDLAPGTYLLQVRAIGYVAATWILVLEAGDALDRVIALDRVEVLPAVRVEGHADRWAAGFEARRADGRGYFLDERQIQATGARRLSDLLRNVPGVRAVCRAGTCAIRMARAPAECTPEYILDGFPASNAVGAEMPTVGVKAIEVYRTLSETPVQFLRTQTFCGTIVIWTRSGP